MTESGSIFLNGMAGLALMVENDIQKTACVQSLWAFKKSLETYQCPYKVRPYVCITSPPYHQYWSFNLLIAARIFILFYFIFTEL